MKSEGKEGITEWYSRSPAKMNALAWSGKECKRFVRIKDGHNAIIFDKSSCTQDDIIITPFTPCYACICVTFSVEGEHEQIILTDFDTSNPDLHFRGISATGREVRIWGATTDSKYVTIQHESKKGS